MVQRHVQLAVRPDPDGERGAIIVIVALSVVALIIFLAFNVDIGVAREQKRKAQAAADAAAEAGALQIQGGGSCAGTASACAALYALRDGFDSTAATVNIPPASGPNHANASCVEVITTKSQTSLFASIAAISSLTVKGRAVACPRGVSLGNFSIIVLNPTACSAFFNNAKINLNLGTSGIYVNSNCTTGNQAMFNNFNFTLNATSFADVVGGFSGGAIAGPAPATHVARPASVDPEASLPIPVPPLLPSVTLCTQDHGTFQPGLYACKLTINGNSTFVAGNYNILGGIDIETNGVTLTLNAGEYTLGGVGFLNNANNDTITGNGAFFYLPNSGLAGAHQWNMNGNNATVTLTAPTAAQDATYAGVVLFQPGPSTPGVGLASNTTQVLMNGNNGGGMSGVLYAPGANILWNGNNAAQTSTAMISDTLTFNGNNTAYNSNATGFAETSFNGAGLSE
jgi:hypothetical protein